MYLPSLRKLRKLQYKFKVNVGFGLHSKSLFFCFIKPKRERGKKGKQKREKKGERRGEKKGEENRREEKRGEERKENRREENRRKLTP